MVCTTITITPDAGLIAEKGGIAIENLIIMVVVAVLIIIIMRR